MNHPVKEKGTAAAPAESAPQDHEASPSDELLAGKLALLEEFDCLAGYRNGLKRMAAMVDEYAGLPIDLEGEDLCVEPSFKFAEIFNKPDPLDAPENGIKLRNRFWSKRHRCEVCVFEQGGKALAVPVRGSGNQVDALLRTMGVSYAWGVEQEGRAVQLLGRLLKHHLFKMYLLTGAFLESSERSGVTYIFRRLRPTVALVIDKPRENMRGLCTLCMHPIGYYRGSWGGAMCPTDDVVAHLQLMRADEHMFWRRCNQHPIGHPLSGL
jgi:hypothetical protein